MFDTIVIEGLKLKAPKEVTSFLKEHNAELPSEFQTKDLDNVLATYHINEKGDVYEDVRKITGKKIPYEFPFKNWHDNRSFLERVYWNIKNKQYSLSDDNRFIDEIKMVRKKSKLTNTVTMLSFDEVGGRYLTLDYEVKVVEGKVKSVKLLRWEIESKSDAQKRNKDNEEFKLKAASEIEARKSFQSKWYYPIIKETYNPLVFFSRLIAQSICNAIVRWSYRWNGV